MISLLTMAAKKDISGQTFGYWTATSDNHVTHLKKTHWLCICKCGTKKYIDVSALIQGKSLSCGCYRSEFFKKLHTTHGKSKHRLHSLWRGIKDRCYNPKNSNYHLYGKRGICLYPAWINDFNAFYTYIETAIGINKTESLDRINTNKNYEPGNLRWATRQQQSWNTRKLSGKYKGVSKTYYEKYKAQITCKGVKYYLGVFKTEEEAAIAYNKAAKQFFGEYAHLNKL